MGGTDIPVQENRRSPVTVPRPAGIGLHLNNLRGTVAESCNANLGPVEKDLGNDYFRVQGEMALPQRGDQRVSDSRYCITSRTLTGSVSVKSTLDSYSPLVCTSIEKSEQNQQLNLTSMLPNSSVSLPSPVNVHPLESSLHTMVFNHAIAPCSMKRTHPEDPCRLEEQNETSPKKKSKQASESDGCKHCNCKKSKCLKLYCDCFAAGVYCDEACACQACLNRPEYENTVLDTRQQIENHNPLAFAPKVIVHVA